MLYLLTDRPIYFMYLRIKSRFLNLNYITANVQAVLYIVVTVNTIDIEKLTKLVT